MNEKIIIDKRGLHEEESHRLFEATVDKARDIHRRVKAGKVKSDEAFALIVCDRDGRVDTECGGKIIKVLSIITEYLCEVIDSSNQNFMKSILYAAAIDTLKAHMPNEAEDDDSDELINALFNDLFGGEK